MLRRFGVPPNCDERGDEVNRRLIALARLNLPPHYFDLARHLLMMEVMGDDPHQGASRSMHPS